MKPGVRMGIDIFNFSRSQTSTGLPAGSLPRFEHPSPSRLKYLEARSEDREVRERDAPDPSSLPL